MRVALRQQPHQRGQVADPINRMRRREKTGGPQIHRFDRVVAEMLIEPRTPCRTDGIARLQHRLKSRSKSATHKPEMAAVLARHQFKDSACLAVPLDADYDAFIGPLHDAV